MAILNQYYVILIGFVIIGAAIAYLIGNKKRIGFAWTLFFSIFLSPLAGLLFSILSPPLEKLPPDNPKVKVVNIVLCVLFAVYAALAMIYEPEVDQKIFSVISPLGLAIYLANRSRRNKKMYADFMAKRSLITELDEDETTLYHTNF